MQRGSLRSQRAVRDTGCRVASRWDSPVFSRRKRECTEPGVIRAPKVGVPVNAPFEPRFECTFFVGWSSHHSINQSPTNAGRPAVQARRLVRLQKSTGVLRPFTSTTFRWPTLAVQSSRFNQPFRDVEKGVFAIEGQTSLVVSQPRKRLRPAVSGAEVISS